MPPIGRWRSCIGQDTKRSTWRARAIGGSCFAIACRTRPFGMRWSLSWMRLMGICWRSGSRLHNLPIMSRPMKLTPMLEQYFEIKRQAPDALLFFRMGDFYEMFFEDAEKA